MTPDILPAQFETGVADFVSGWFMQRQTVSEPHALCQCLFIIIQLVAQKLSDGIYMSPELQSAAGMQFIHDIQDAERIVDCILNLICPELHSIGTQAINKLKEGAWLENRHESIKQWTSMYSGIEVIVNRVTPVHRDPAAAPTMYDFLISAGTHEEVWLDLPDVKARLSYNPGTAVALSGRVLRHGVAKWISGERICIAHFIRENVHERLGLHRPDWVTQRDYLHLMPEDFVNRHGWGRQL